MHPQCAGFNNSMLFEWSITTPATTEMAVLLGKGKECVSSILVATKDRGNSASPRVSQEGQMLVGMGKDQDSLW